VALAAVVIAGVLISAGRGHAFDQDKQDKNDNDNESRIQKGFAIAPVKLNLTGKNRALVGLGSYIVNAQADCNGCHSPSPATEFTAGGNPYFGQRPTVVNPDTYLAGGQDFGPFPAPDSSVHIVSRNLTPDKTGRPEGGHTLSEFIQIMRTGIDMAKVHPTCSATVTTNCLPPPFDGSLLQIMPWPIYHNMSDHDLLAIYEYLSAIPCLEGGPGEPANRCK
jgi:hypothetical protein